MLRAARLPLAIVLFAEIEAGAVPESVQQAFRNYQQQISKVPASRATQFRRLVASDLRKTYPELLRPALTVRRDADQQDAAEPAARGEDVVLEKRAPQTKPIWKRLAAIESLTPDTNRARAVTELAAAIRSLPNGAERSLLASTLCVAATEGHLGEPAVDAAASTLAQALRDLPVPPIHPYLELASLSLYGHIAPLPPDPGLDAAIAILQLRDAIHEATGFALLGLDGKSYVLRSLRGHVVLLNFWATWCGPCRREMPDMERLYERFGEQGLVVLAVSDEKPGTVHTFAAKQRYSFPFALDPNRKLNAAFFVDGVPQTFVFDREGKLVTQSVNMCTERQFLELLKPAGLH